MVDSHCHLYDIPDIDTEMQRCRDAKINIIICNGAGITTNDKAWEMAQKFENVYATAGCHPEEMESSVFSVQNSISNKLREQINRKGVVAVGECGLDYYPDTKMQDAEMQRKLFKINIDLAKEYRLPLVVHCRNAFDDVFKLVDYDRVQMHCFTGNQKQMEKCVERGWYISFGGIITFKNDGGLRAVAREIPEKLILTETDAPWLSPEPFRGQKNSPIRVKYVYEALALIRNQSLPELEEIVEDNTRRLFNL